MLHQSTPRSVSRIAGDGRPWRIMFHIYTCSGVFKYGRLGIWCGNILLYCDLEHDRIWRLYCWWVNYVVSTVVLVQWRVMDYNTESANLSLIDPIWGASICRQVVVSFHKRPVMQKAYPFYDIFLRRDENKDHKEGRRRPQTPGLLTLNHLRYFMCNLITQTASIQFNQTALEIAVWVGNHTAWFSLYTIGDKYPTL